MATDFNFTNTQFLEMDRFSRPYLPDTVYNNLGYNRDNQMHFDSAIDAVDRSDRFVKDAGLCTSIIDSGLTFSQWHGVHQASREDVIADNKRVNPDAYRGVENPMRVMHLDNATQDQRRDIGLYALEYANNMHAERIFMESMGLDTESMTDDRGRSYESFERLIQDNPRLRPTHEETARFEELTGFERNAPGDNKDHSVESTMSRFHVSPGKEQEFEQFRTEYLADRGLEYDPVTKTAEKEGTAAERRAEMTVDRDTPPQTQSFSQGLGGMADSFVAEHDAQQAARQQQPQFGAAAGRGMTQDGPEFG